MNLDFLTWSWECQILGHSIGNKKKVIFSCDISSQVEVQPSSLKDGDAEPLNSKQQEEQAENILKTEKSCSGVFYSLLLRCVKNDNLPLYSLTLTSIFIHHVLFSSFYKLVIISFSLMLEIRC